MTMDNGAPLVPAIVYSPATTFTVFENIPTNVARYFVKVTAVDPRSGATANLLIKVKVLCVKGFHTTPSIDLGNLFYNMDLYTPVPNELTITIPAYETTPVGCDSSGYSFFIRKVDRSAMPAFITERSAGVWIIKSQNRADIGSYNFEIFAYDS
jgi:hypothetical protein